MADRRCLRVGLIGWPVEHSVSPAMQNAAFEALRLPWRYVLLPTPPDKVETSLQTLKSQGYRGANVTIPLKQAVMPYLDEISDAAQAIGAVNTIVVQQGRLGGHNTDGEGFVAALREAGFEPDGQQALVLGAGGVARSVVYALGQARCPITVYNRTRLRAEALARDMQALGLQTAVAANLGDLDLDCFRLLVNATSVGMSPQIDASPWPQALTLPSTWTVFDLIYSPAETRLLARARASGATAVGGLGMLIHQGALAFKFWTGHSPPIEVMRTAAETALYHRVM